ncbi:MAG: arginine--tRNA ligase [Alphaproteobacteria bacterium]|nr:arginine--tRNA ligase [Alphaproteobacteria bacterium]
MNLFTALRDLVLSEVAALVSAGELPPNLDTSTIAVEPPREVAHGDVATNVAMVLAKPAKRSPRDIATLIAARLKRAPDIEAVEIAGPGFINLRLTPSFWHARLGEILREGIDYGVADLGKGAPVNVEYVSANPTGPLHVGHGRGTVFGEVLASLLARMGYKVTREYYINDAGAQVDILARSAHLRYREALGESIGEMPEGLYPGDYLKPVGLALASRDGAKWRDTPEAEWLPIMREGAIDAMMRLIKDDLGALGVKHDVFSSERKLVEDGKVEAAFKQLEAAGLIYTGVLEPPKGKPAPDDWEPRPQSLFRATQFGDDVDRPLKKSDGSWTYFATDIAYHRDKIARGFTDMIDVWGADHGGYIKRMQAAVEALSNGKAALDVKVCQLVRLLDNGEPVKMSKRAGQFVTLRDVVARVGKDVVRFILLTRRNDASLDFDLAKVTEQSKDNPIFYVQYAHARVHSVLRHAVDEMPAVARDVGALAKVDFSPLTDEAELGLIKLAATWPRVLEQAALSHEPHRLAFFLQELAAAFHRLWNKGNDDPRFRFVIASDSRLTEARLGLIVAISLIIAAGLDIFGIEPAEEMRSR